jgi:hypothetical protein
MIFQGSVVLTDSEGKELSARVACAFSVEFEPIKGKLNARLVTPRVPVVLTASMAGSEPRVSFFDDKGEEVLWKRVGSTIQVGEMAIIRPQRGAP